MSLCRARRALTLLAAGLAATGNPADAHAESRAPVPWIVPTYADLADLADNAPLVLRARIRKVAEVEPGRAPNVKPGWARIYVESVTENLLSGPAAVGETLRYLADIKRDSRGKVPKLAKQGVLLFARYVAGHPGELQLVAPDAQLPWNEATETTLRSILVALFAADSPRRITGVHEAIFVPGTLVGEGESQIFLATGDGEPAAITVHHQTGLPVSWNVSFSEVVEIAGRPPEKDSLTWYRLACFLPPELPAGVNVSATPADAAQAEADYSKVMADLGPCPRNRGN